jgi:hypothetical protein
LGTDLEKCFPKKKRPNAHWQQQQQQAEAQRKAAQTVFSVHTRSELELEALKLCHHMTL